MAQKYASVEWNIEFWNCVCVCGMCVCPKNIHSCLGIQKHAKNLYVHKSLKTMGKDGYFNKWFWEKLSLCFEGKKAM